MRLLVVNSHPRSNSRELMCAVLACFEGELKMKKVLAILLFLFVPATVIASGFPLLSDNNGSYQAADYSGMKHSLVSALVRTAATPDGKALVIARSDGGSENQHKEGDSNKYSHNHNNKPKSKYDLRDIDGKQRGDGHKHLHGHNHNHDQKARSKYDLRDTDGHDHKHGHKHDDGDVHKHGHGEDHKHVHGEAHQHNHGDTGGHGHGDEHGALDDHGHHGHGHGHGDHEHGGEAPEGMYDRVWDVVTLG
jgi:hypothetical protein